MAVGDLWQMTVVGSVAGQQTENVLHFQEGTLAFNADQLASAFIDNVLPAWRTANSNGHVFQKLSIRKMNPIPLDPTEYPIANGTGAMTGDPMAPQCAVVASIRTGQGGRSARGRIYFAGLSEGGQSAGQLLPDDLGRYQAAANALLTTFPDNVGPSGFIVGVFSRKEGYLAPNYDPTKFRAAKTITVNPYVATQRRRGRLG